MTTKISECNKCGTEVTLKIAEDGYSHWHCVKCGFRKLHQLNFILINEEEA